MNEKTLLWLTIGLGVVLAGFAVYVLFFKKSETALPSGNTAAVAAAGVGVALS